MPIFMDRHFVEGASQEAVAEAHLKDLEIQHQFNCKAITYWLDNERGYAFCLIEAPSKSDVVKMHEKAHGLIPNEVIEVDPLIVQSFLGRIQDPKKVTYKVQNGVQLKVFSDTSFRIIANITSTHRVLLQNKFGVSKAKQLLVKQNAVLNKHLQKGKGRKVVTDGHSFVASFNALSPAVRCMYNIQKEMHSISEKINLRIAVHAGNPVDESKNIFGETLQLIKLLCLAKDTSHIIFSATVSQLLQQSNIPVSETKKKVKIITPTEEHFLIRLGKVLFNHWNNPGFDIKNWCKHMAVSKSKLYRECVNIIGVSPNTLLKQYRLSQAIESLGKTNQNIAQTAFDNGFNSPSYFTKCFYKQYGMTPSRFMDG